MKAYEKPAIYFTPVTMDIPACRPPRERGGNRHTKRRRRRRSKGRMAKGHH